MVDLPDANDAVGHAAPDRLVVVDDRNAFRDRAAIIVQPSLQAWSGSGLADRILAGFAYAPVGQAYRTLRAAEVGPTVRPSAGPGASGRPSVVACFGGSDPAQVGRRLAAAIAGNGQWDISLVVGADFKGGVDDLSIPVAVDPADLADRLARCDLAVIGAGTMKFEVACIGRPALLLAVADDQLAVGPAYAATGAARWLGDGRTIASVQVRQAIEVLLAAPGERTELSTRAWAVIDGRGADRIVDAIEELWESTGR